MRLGHWAGDSKAPEGSGASVGLLVWRAGSLGSWLRSPRCPILGVSQLLPGAGSGGCRAPGSPGATAGPLESVDESQGGLLRGPTCLGADVRQLFQRAWCRVADHWVPGGWLWDHGVPGIGIIHSSFSSTLLASSCSSIQRTLSLTYLTGLL